MISPQTPRFSDITTLEVGGKIAEFVEPDSRASFLEAIIMADIEGKPLCVIGGGSNMVVSDDSFDGVVIRDARRSISILDEAAPVEDGAPALTTVSATAGVHWDVFVAYCVRMGLAGVEALSGIPGTVGASVVQNIGAYGQEVAGAVTAVEVWDRATKKVLTLQPEDMNFGYRQSALKQSMYSDEVTHVPSPYFPSPRYIVLEVTFTLTHSGRNVVDMEQLARAIGVQVGQECDIEQIRQAVLEIRAGKGMVEDSHRYDNEWMKNTIDVRRDESGIDLESVQPDRDRYSCGSFFMNPILTRDRAEKLPQDAPRFEATLSDGTKGVKTSAAWLIDRAGFNRGFKIEENSRAGLSTKHTLALTNRGEAQANDVLELARVIISGVYDTFGITLVPEPVLIGVEL